VRVMKKDFRGGESVGYGLRAHREHNRPPNECGHINRLANPSRSLAEAVPTASQKETVK
jgi:hypothetical protein